MVVSSGLHDLHFDSCEIWLNCTEVFMALEDPLKWQKYRSHLDKIRQSTQVMQKISFNFSSPKANSLARDIVCNITKEGRFTSYLALGGPASLQHHIEKDR